MTIPFDSLLIEWYNGANWLDLTADVLTEPAPHGTRGIQSTDINARIANAGTLTFSLKNGVSNQAGLQGYYTPGHPNCLSPNWGLPYLYPVRVIVSYDDRDKYLWYGTFEPGPDGVTVVPGIYAERRVDVKFRDWMGLANERKLNGLTVQTYQGVGNAVRYLLARLDADEQPQASSIAYGDGAFKAVFDNLNNGTTVYSELSKLAASELSYIYTRADRTTGECLVVENRNLRWQAGGLSSSVGYNDTDGYMLLEDGSYMLLEDGGKMLLNLAYNSVSRVSKSTADCGYMLLESGDYMLYEDGSKMILNEAQDAAFDGTDIGVGDRALEVSHYDNAYMSARVSSRQKRIDASAVVLWAMESPLQIGQGQTLTGIRGRYRDPSGGASYINGKDFVTLVSGTDWAAYANDDATGTNYTANITVTANPGAAEVEFTLYNSGSLAYVTTLQQRGYGIYDYDSLDIVIGEDTGKKRVEINLNYETDSNVGRRFAQSITRVYNGTPTIQRMPLFANRDSYNLNAFMDLDIGSLVDVSETVAYPDAASPYFINGYEFDIIPSGDTIPFIIWTPNGFPYSRVYTP